MSLLEIIYRHIRVATRFAGVHNVKNIASSQIK